MRSHINPKMRSPIHKKPDRGAPETGFFPKYFATTHRCGQKPGFLDRWVAQKPGFFRNTSLQPTDSGKNPVSLVGGGAPETGFLPKYFGTTHRFGQKPGFFDYPPPLTPSNRRKCTRPDRSPATTVTPSGAIAQQ